MEPRRAAVDQWWQAMSLAQQTFHGVAIVASAVMTLQTVLMLLGGHHEPVPGDSDGGPPGGHLNGLHVLSVRAVTAFATGFGWGGVCSLDAGLPLGAAVAIAVLAGAALVALILWLMRSLTALGESGSLDYRNAIGVVGTVYLPIPARRGGTGQIEVMVQGRLAVVHACTTAAETLPGRSRVKVVGLQDPTTLLVDPLT
jgi:hypothetical protein